MWDYDSNHTNACFSIKNWLNSGRHTQANFSIEGSIQRMNNPWLHYLLSKVRPDIVWFRDSREIEVVCIMEVMADKDSVKTIRKIGLDMIQ